MIATLSDGLLPISAAKELPGHATTPVPKVASAALDRLKNSLRVNVEF
jgi:hypothetical protein